MSQYSAYYCVHCTIGTKRKVSGVFDNIFILLMYLLLLNTITKNEKYINNIDMSTLGIKYRKSTQIG